MAKLSRIILVAVVLLTFASVASAARPDPGAFTVTGYAANLVPTGFPPPLPPLLPTEFQPLPNGYNKVHLRNQGGPGVDDDAYCTSTYGAPCQYLCAAFGAACGVAGGFTGSFVFDEWILTDATMSNGANHGLMTITTGSGQANLRFGGVFGPTALKASYEFLGGTGEYRGLKGGGTKAGTPGAIFTVAYTPCGGKNQPACPADRCALYGGDLKLKKDKAQWTLSNNGESTVTISKVMVVWPAGGPQLDKVKLAGKTIYETPSAAPAVTIAAGWSGEVGDRQIGAGKQRDLWLEFGDDISAQPWDYTILVEFAEGCAVPFMAFP
jgi:hypothetical protein